MKTIQSAILGLLVKQSIKFRATVKTNLFVLAAIVSLGIKVCSAENLPIYTVFASAASNTSMAFITDKGPKSLNNVQVKAGNNYKFTLTPLSGYAISREVAEGVGYCAKGSWSGDVYTTGAISANCKVEFYSFPIGVASGSGTAKDPWILLGCANIEVPGFYRMDGGEKGIVFDVTSGSADTCFNITGPGGITLMGELPVTGQGAGTQLPYSRSLLVTASAKRANGRSAINIAANNVTVKGIMIYDMASGANLPLVFSDISVAPGLSRVVIEGNHITGKDSPRLTGPALYIRDHSVLSAPTSPHYVVQGNVFDDLQVAAEFDLSSDKIAQLNNNYFRNNKNTAVLYETRGPSMFENIFLNNPLNTCLYSPSAINQYKCE